MAAPIKSFAAIAEAKAEEKALKTVQLEGHVVLKIVKHCKESQPALVTGQLLGLDIGSTLEVTDCFPFPSQAREEEDQDTDGATYQLDMMRCLREVNVDNNTVGWYQSTLMGSFQTLELIETFVNYQESIKRCICIIYDPQRSTACGLKAVKLQDSFMELYKGGVMTADKLKASGISWHQVFEEIHITIHNSTLVTALAAHIEPDAPATQAHVDTLNLSMVPLLEKNLDFMNECLDDLVSEQQKISFYHRNVARQQLQQTQFLQKRRQENAQRRAAGEEPLPEEDPNLFKPIPEPSPLEGFLLNNQIANYCDSMNTLATQASHRLHLVEALQKGRVAG